VNTPKAQGFSGLINLASDIDAVRPLSTEPKRNPHKPQRKNPTIPSTESTAAPNPSNSQVETKEKRPQPVKAVGLVKPPKSEKKKESDAPPSGALIISTIAILGILLLIFIVQGIKANQPLKVKHGAKTKSNSSSSAVHVSQRPQAPSASWNSESINRNSEARTQNGTVRIPRKKNNLPQRSRPDPESNTRPQQDEIQHVSQRPQAPSASWNSESINRNSEARTQNGTVRIPRKKIILPQRSGSDPESNTRPQQDEIQKFKRIVSKLRELDTTKAKMNIAAEILVMKKANSNPEAIRFWNSSLERKKLEVKTQENELGSLLRIFAKLPEQTKKLIVMSENGALDHTDRKTLNKLTKLYVSGAKDIF